MIKILFIILVIYAIYKLVKGGYVSFTTPPATAGTVTGLVGKVGSFLKSVF